MDTNVRRERRRFRILSWTGAALVFGIVATANFVLSVIPLRLDTSAGGVYSVSKATKGVISRLDDTLLVRVVFSRQLPPVYKINERYVTDLLAEYKRASGGKIRVEIFDPGQSPKNRELAIDYGVVPVQLDVLERDRREVAERFMGLAFFYGDKTEAIPFVQDVQNLEYEITVRIKKLVDPRKTVVGFITNGGAATPQSPSLEAMRRPLNELYDIRSIDATAPIPPEVRTAWWIAPTQAAPETVVQNIRAFLAGGGSVGLMADTHEVDISKFRATPVAFDWSAVLGAWGMSIDKGFIVDPRCDRIQIRAVQGPFQMINVIDYPYFPLISAINRSHAASRGIDAVTMPFVSSIDYKDAQPGLRYSSLAETSQLSYLDQNPLIVTPLDDRVRSPDAPGGPFNVAVLVEGKFDGGGKDGHLLVMGTSRLVRAEYPMRPSNYAFFFNLLDWLSQDELLLTIRSKGFARRPLRPLPDAARTAVKYGTVAALPIAALCVGMVVWRRQSRRRMQIALEYRDV